MDIRKIMMGQPHWSFRYDGKRYDGYEADTARETREVAGEAEGEEAYEIKYEFGSGILVHEELRIYGWCSAARVMLRFENAGGERSRQLTEIHDVDIGLAMNGGYEPAAVGHRMRPEGKARVYRSVGSNWVRDEFFEYAEYIAPGQERVYRSEGGRSSQGLMPYFDLSEGSRGALVAIGWTGQWEARFAGEGDEVRVSTGIEGLDFYLEPREKVRTSSAAVMLYDSGREEARVTWRRFFKRHIAPIGKGQRPKEGPISLGAWGAISSGKMIERIEKITAYGIDAEYYWIDAGWYGYSTGPCPTAFDGDWGSHTGSWVVNSTYHPDGLMEVAKTIKDHGLKFLLWLEPERVLRGTDMPKAHPDWFLEMSPEDGTLLLDLSNPEAVQGAYDLVAGYIERFDLKCYRQDFNINPLAYWRKYDAEGRKGITEIGYITGLYRFWDMLLERFPDLLIDNCASGGRRNDIEMMSRSIPLWRSDYQCTADCEPEVAQIHTTGLSRWLPYHGTTPGGYIEDAYSFRSVYAPTFTINFWCLEAQEFVEEDEKSLVAKKYIAEYKSIRPYLSCDYYALVENSTCDTTWCAWQYNRPEEGDGIILAFRRPDSPMTAAAFDLRGLSEGSYAFADADSGEQKVMSRGEIAAKGFEVAIPEKRSSRLIRYKKG